MPGSSTATGSPAGSTTFCDKGARWLRRIDVLKPTSNLFGGGHERWATHTAKQPRTTAPPNPMTNLDTTTLQPLIAGVTPHLPPKNAPFPYMCIQQHATGRRGGNRTPRSDHCMFSSVSVRSVSSAIPAMGRGGGDGMGQRRPSNSHARTQVNAHANGERCGHGRARAGGRMCGRMCGCVHVWGVVRRLRRGMSGWASHLGHVGWMSHLGLVASGLHSVTSAGSFSMLSMSISSRRISMRSNLACPPSHPCHEYGAPPGLPPPPPPPPGRCCDCDCDCDRGWGCRCRRRTDVDGAGYVSATRAVHATWQQHVAAQREEEMLGCSDVLSHVLCRRAQCAPISPGRLRL